MNISTLSIVEQEQRDKVHRMDSLRIVVSSASKRHLDELVRVVQDAAGNAAITPMEGALQQVGMFPSQMVPDVLIVDSAGEGRGDLDHLERLGQIYPNLAFLVVCERQSPDFLIQAMQAGVREVLPSPTNPEALGAALERIRNKLGFAPTRKGRILAFISCKGGSGATFLATNLAHALAAKEMKKVALFDFNLQFGDALLFLSDQKPATTLTDVARGIHRLDAAFLASSMANVELGLSVLAAPDDPAGGMEVKPEHIDALLRLARNHYYFIILDVARNLDAQAIKALDHADTIFTVLQTTLPFIRDGKRLLDVFRTLDYPKDKIQLVVNRFEKGGDISIGELEQSLGSKVLCTIPNHYEAVAASVNQGVPIAVLARNSPVTKALSEWSESLVQAPAQDAGSWIKRVFKRA